MTRHETTGQGAADMSVACAAQDERDELEVVRGVFGRDFDALATLYRNDSPPRIAALHRAAAGADYSQLAMTAHAFGGSSVSVGATGLAALCKELERRAKTNALDDFAQRMAAIETEYARICGKLEAMCRADSKMK